jgi:membrane protein required for colicin V production
MLSNALPKEMRDQFLLRSRELQQEWEKRVMEKLKDMKGNTGAKT